MRPPRTARSNRRFRLVYSEAIADSDGNIVPAEHLGMPAGMPTETSVVVELEDFGHRTRMVMTYIGVRADSPGGHGWAMAIDKLDARVLELRDMVRPPQVQ